MQIIFAYLGANRTKKMSLLKVSEKIVEYMSENGINQQTLAKQADVHQSQISRITNNEFKRMSKNVKKICKYANIDIEKIKISNSNSAENPILIEALNSVWDGTNNNAKALAKVIKSLKGL